jgi:uncharacterized protein (TIRG00374 family)
MSQAPPSSGHAVLSGAWFAPRRAGQIVLGLLVSALLLWLTLRQIELSQAWQALCSAHWWFLAPAVATYFADLAARTWRWSVLLRPVQPLSWRRLYGVVILGYMGNMLLPARLGELLRAGLLSRRGISGSAALGSIATERVLDGLTTVAILLVASHFLPRPEWLAAGLITVTALFLAALLALALMLALRPSVTRVLARMAARYPRSQRLTFWILRFLDGLGVLSRPSLLAGAVGIGLLAWTLSALEYFWIFRAFDLPLGPMAILFALSAMSLSTIVPSAPGYVGTLEFAGVAVLGALGIAPADAFSATVLIHLLQIVPVTVAGLPWAWREGLSPGREMLPPA